MSTWYSCRLIFTRFPVTGFFLRTRRWYGFTTYDKKTVCVCVFECVYLSIMVKPHPATFQSKLSCLMALYTSAMMS